MDSTPNSSDKDKPELQSALTKLALHAEVLTSKERERDWLPLMRNKAFELGIHEDVKDAELQAYLEAAERRQDKGQAYRAGEKLQATESVFLLDGLIKLGEANVIIGQPKVGKSSFSTGLIAALRDRRETFLGRDLSLPSQKMPVLIFGTDQSEGDWLHLLRREDIVKEDMSLDLDFFSSLETGDEYNFTKDGLRHMKEEISKHQFPLVVIDSLSSMMEPTGIEENTSRYAQPIRNAIKQLRETGATLLIIHHSVKRPNTWDWITECRGSSSISSVFSWGVLMRWVALEDEGLARSDFRVGFSGKGRGSNSGGGVMGQYMDEGGWTFLDGLEAAQQVEKVRQRIMELGGVRVNVFDYLTMRTELQADVSTEELATELNKTRSNMARELNILKSKGLAHVVRWEKTGTRPRPFWKISPSAEEALSLGGSQDDFFDLSDSFPNKINKINKFNSQDSTAELPAKAKESIPSKTTAEVLNEDGTWSNGWIVRDGSNPDAVVLERIGNPMVTKGTRYAKPIRWGMDARPCSSPFKSPSPETNEPLF